MTLYVDWLPPATAVAALQNDTATFEAAATAFVEQWEASNGKKKGRGGKGGGAESSTFSSSLSSSSAALLPPHERALETLPWVSVFNK